MPRVFVEFQDWCQLDDAAKIHDGDARADVLHDCEIVGDEQISQPELFLEIGKQIDDLRLDRDVERRYRLVADDQFRRYGERAGDADALALAAGEFMRVARAVVGIEADQRQQLDDAVFKRDARPREFVDNQTPTMDTP